MQKTVLTTMFHRTQQINHTYRRMHKNTKCYKTTLNKQRAQCMAKIFAYMRINYSWLTFKKTGGSALQRHVRMFRVQILCLAYAQIRPYLTNYVQSTYTQSVNNIDKLQHTSTS